jgi:triosephosphate isomerase
MAPRKLVAGNWKMNGIIASAAFIRDLAAIEPDPLCDVLICPPFTLVARFAEGPYDIGGQDCHWDPSGAHTGDIAAEMLADAGAVAVIVGHSERRIDHAETDAEVARKAAAAWRAEIAAIVCIGESEAERTAGQTLDRVSEQLAGSIPDGATARNLCVAYEPIWAIGTGRTPTLEQIAEVHAHIRTVLTRRFGEAEANGMRLLYGGSVKPANAADIFGVANVDGALVGGASLDAADFGAIIAAAGRTQPARRSVVRP